MLQFINNEFMFYHANSRFNFKNETVLTIHNVLKNCINHLSIIYKFFIDAVFTSRRIFFIIHFF